MFVCADCDRTEPVPRFGYRFGNACRCPRCGIQELTQLKERDHIDTMESGLWNLVARIGGGKLYHCSFCRLQFYDRRPLAVKKSPKPETGPEPAKTA